MDAKDVQALARDLRAWSGRIAAGPAGADDDDNDGPASSLTLERHLRKLDAWSEDLLPSFETIRLSWGLQPAAQRRTYGGQALLSFLLASRHLRQKDSARA
eukprot:10763690-Alexandrium_andersonii.AAC.1